MRLKLKSVLPLLVVLLFCSCGRQVLSFTAGHYQSESQNTPIHPAWCYSATIYELNTRQFTPEGTFAAAEKELERLRDLGVDIIWMMPLQPIGLQERKGELGSYYAIRDYKGVNPEFGTEQDIKSFIDKAHSLGMKVLLDWVANHTSPDAVWTANPGWHKRDESGNFIVNFDWTDIAQLNYESGEMRSAMIDAMKYWLEEIGMDGFRCDMAMMVPLDFWRQAKAELIRSKPDLFLLAEAEETWLVSDVFDAYYAWELHHLMNSVATGGSDAEKLWNYFGKQSTRFPRKAIPMTFTSNHDENSHSDTEFVRMGGEPAARAFAAFTYVVPSMPLIYTGQELGNTKRLEFFDKDRIIPNNPQEYTALYQNLNTLKKSNRALQAAEAGGDMLRVNNDDKSNRIFSMKRFSPDNVVIAVFNFSDSTMTTILDDVDLNGEFAVFPTGETTRLAPRQSLTLAPWEYVIYTRNL